MIVLDQLTKYLVMQHISYGQVTAIIPSLNLTQTHNVGAAFSFLSSASGWQRWFFMGIASVISLFLIRWLYQLPTKHHGTALGISLVIGGALGNLCDRIIHGYVIDFIQVYYRHWYWPDFNVADSAICVGAVIIIFSLMRKT
jgi:signal peptidase II